MADDESGIERKMREIQARIGQLESAQRQLERALDEIDHEGRRVADRIERAGGHDRSAEAERDRIAASRATHRRDFESNSRALEELREEATDLQQRIDALRRG